MLHSVPEKLEQVAISMETLLDLNSLSIEEAVSHLWEVEQRKKGPSSPAVDTGGRLLLTEEEWMAWMKAIEKGGSNGGGSFGGGGDRGCRRGCGRGHGGSHNGRVNSNFPQEGAGRVAYHNCGKMGHWARECHAKAKKGEAHTVVDDEPSLLLLEAGSIQTKIENPPPSSSGGAGDTTGRFIAAGVCECGGSAAEANLQGIASHSGFRPPGGI
jgi:hypothetical protein